MNRRQPRKKSLRAATSKNQGSSNGQMDGPPQQLDEISEIQKQISGAASNSNIHANDRLFQYAQSETYDGNRVIKKIY